MDFLRPDGFGLSASGVDFIEEGNEVIDFLRIALPQPLFLICLLGIVPIVYFGKGGRTFPVVLRILSVCLVTLALTGIGYITKSSREHLVYLLDISDSMAREVQENAIDWINTLETEPERDRTSTLIVFGGGYSVEKTDTLHLEIEGIQSVVDTASSNIETAVYGALSVLSEGAQGKIILLSDGNETTGEIFRAARVSGNAGVPIFPVLFSSGSPDTAGAGNEIQVTDLKVPSLVRSGEKHRIEVTIESRYASQARLLFVLDGNYLGEESIGLAPGSNSFEYTGLLDEKGFHLYEVFIESGEDTYAENNYYQALVKTAGYPHILYVHKTDGMSDLFLEALKVQKIPAEAIPVDRLPSTLPELIRYDAVIFDNVPAYDLSLESMDLIERYIRTGGGGFLMIGGDTGFGVGGYYQTPIEKALPVDMDVTSSMQKPSMTMVMIVDKSGSMSERVSGRNTKLDMVKDAVISAVDVLNPFYQVGLLTFDAEYEWTVPLTRAGEKERIADDLSRLGSSGGTLLYPAMEEALRVLSTTESAVKHCIILSDGLSAEADFKSLTNKMAQEGITVSTIAVSDSSDIQLMDSIARWGGGRSYFAPDMDSVPRIFTSESLIASKGLVVEEIFFPSVSARHEILEGIELSPPSLRGFVLTYNKTGSMQILSGYNGSPLLSVSQYGLGRTAAFTSDVSGRWSGNWLLWQDFPKFVSQLLRWIERPEPSSFLSTDISIEKGRGRISVDLVDAENQYINNARLEGVLIDPDLIEEKIVLGQTGPGRYEYPFDAGKQGRYIVTVFGESADYDFAPDTFGSSVSYEAEYSFRETNFEKLRQAAFLSGGQTLSMENGGGETLRSYSGNASEELKPLWPYILAAAVFLYIIELFHRTFVINPGMKEFLTGRRMKKSEYSGMIGNIEDELKKEKMRHSDDFWFGPDRGKGK
jgi:Ca-activated chloride channel homolog